MREIKFRVWDKVKNEWFPVKNAMAILLNNDNKENLVFITKDGPYPIPQTDQDLGGRNRFEIQQFTGLLDKNGVEIYEGDILKLDTRCPETGYIDFAKGGFTFHAKNMNGTYLGIVISGFGEDAIIIGNIYETPNLK